MTSENERPPLERGPQREHPTSKEKTEQQIVGDGAAGSNAIELHVDAIPLDLRSTDNWVAWRKGPPRKDRGKFDKQPINATTGALASTTDSSTWSSFDDALARMRADQLAGVGFVFTLDVGFVGIDLDHCRDAQSGKIDPWARDIIDAIDSYTEISPSGTGVHIIARGSLPQGGRHRGKVEMYDSGRYFTVTGVVVAGTPNEVVERSDQIAMLHGRTFGAKQPRAASQPALEIVNATTALTDDELIAKASAASNGAKFKALFDGDWSNYESQNEADLALCGLLAFYAGPDAARIDALFRRSGLMRDKWDTKRREQTYGAMTIAKALEGRTEFYNSSSSSAPALSPKKMLKCTDTGNAERLVARANGDLRFCHPWKKWMECDGKRWRIDDTGAALRLGKLVVREIANEAAQSKSVDLRNAYADWGTRSEKVDRRKAMVTLAATESGIPILPHQLDADPWLLNCLNGTLDLRTCKLRPHARDDYLTKLVPVEFKPDAECPLWIRFLTRVLPDADVRAFVHRLVGSWLTGSQREQIITFFVGEGANGKSTLIGTLLQVLGFDYAIQAAPELLLHKRDRGHPTELADLFGVRLAVCTEIGAGSALDEALVKRLTGGDLIKARRMREDFWLFKPTHHLCVAANHRPIIRGTDHAIWRRVVVVPFDVKIPDKEQDLALMDKLLAEREGILAWLIEGCRLWQLDGRLDPPSVVALAVGDYREEMDLLGEFLGEMYVTAANGKVEATRIYRAFCDWSKEHGEPEISQREFGERLRSRGFERLKSDGRKCYRGLALRTRTPQGPSGTDPGMNSYARARAREHDKAQTVPEGPCPVDDTPACAVKACSACGGTDWWSLGDNSPGHCAACETPASETGVLRWSTAGGAA